MRFYSYTLLFYLLISQSGKGLQVDAPPDYHIQHFTDENGLPQNSVKQIIMDSMGFIWLATEGGLVRFDGQKFLVFNKKILGTQSDRFTSFGRNVKDGKLYAIDEFNRFVNIKNGTALLDSVYYVKEEYYRLQLETIKKLPSRNSKTQATTTFPQNPFFYTFFGKENKSYLYVNQSILFFQSGRQIASIPFKGNMDNSITDNDRYARSVTEEGQKMLSVLYFFTVDDHLFYHQNGLGNTFIEITPTGKSTLTLSGDITRNSKFSSEKNKIRIIGNRVNNQAFAYLNRKIYLIQHDANHQFLETKLLIDNFDVEANYINTVYYSKSDGVILLGSLTEGLFLLSPKQFKPVVSSGRKRYDNIFYTQIAHSDSSILTPEGNIVGIGKFKTNTILAMKLDIPSEKNAGLRDRHGFIWIRKRNKVFKFSPDGEKQLEAWQLMKEPLTLYQGIGNEIWIGFKDGTVACLIDDKHQTMSLKTITHANSRITFLYQNVSSYIWIGTMKGLYRFHMDKKTLDVIPGLTQANIRSIYATEPHQIWITTYGDGIFLLQKNKLSRMPSDTQGYLNFSHCILEDKAANFWISTNKGLFQARKQDLLRFSTGESTDVFYHYYAKENGFLTNEFNGGCQPCGIKIADSTFSFPSINGLVWFKPQLVKTASLSYPFIFQNVSLNGKSIPPADTLDLPYTAHNLVLSAESPYFGHPNNLKFRYSLAKIGTNQREQWLIPDKQTISINDLSYGSYILTIQKVTGFGNQYSQKRIFINVATPWFLHWWFIGLSILAFLALVFALVSWRTLFVVRQNRRLNSKITQRTAELTVALDELKVSEQTQQMQLQLQSRIIGVLSHDLRTPLKYLNITSQKFQRQLEKSFPDSPDLYIGKGITESIEHIYQLTNTLLTFVKVTVHKEGVITQEWVQADEVFADKTKIFTLAALEVQTQINVKAQKGLAVYINRQLLEIIIHNLLDNALKASWQSTITLSAQQIGQSVEIGILDAGGGMSTELADWLSQDLNDINQREVPLMIGLGLIEVKELANLLGIVIRVETGNDGTQVYLTL